MSALEELKKRLGKRAAGALANELLKKIDELLKETRRTNQLLEEILTAIMVERNAD